MNLLLIKYEDNLMKIITFLMTAATITTVSGALNFGGAMEGTPPSTSQKSERDEAGAPKRFHDGRTHWMLWTASAGSQRTYYEATGASGGRDERYMDDHYTIESPPFTISRIAGGSGRTVDFHRTIGTHHIRWTYNLESSSLTPKPATLLDAKNARMTEKEFKEWLEANREKYEAGALKFIQGWVQATREK